MAPRGMERGRGYCRIFRPDVVQVFLAGDFRQTPIHHEYFAEAAHHDIRGLEVAVNHAFGVRVSQGLARFDHHADRARQVPAFLLLAGEIEKSR